MNLRETHIQIPGTFNVRDLGGLPAAGGYVVAPKRLYRGELLAFPGAASIHSLWNEEHSAAYRELGVRTIIDLRAASETLSTPSAWPEATGADAVVELPIDDGGEGTDTNYVKMLLSREMERFGPEDMAEFYRNTIDSRAETFAAAVEVIADQSPVLVHCAAGKDRTGLLIAIVLDLLGVPARVVVEDYAFTGVLRPNRAADYADRFDAAGVDMENVRTLFESPSLAMEATLAHIKNKHDGTARYLVEEGGLDVRSIYRLRERLLVRA